MGESSTQLASGQTVSFLLDDPLRTQGEAPQRQDSESQSHLQAHTLAGGRTGVAEVKPQVMLSAHAASVLLICFLFGLVLVWTPLLKVHSHQPPAS